MILLIQQRIGQTLEQAGVKPARIAAVQRLNAGRGAEQAGRRRLPLSVKTRLGYDSIMVEAWIEHLLKESPAAISLHGRTLQQMYRGSADWEAIARAAHLVKGTGTLLLESANFHPARIRRTSVRLGLRTDSSLRFEKGQPLYHMDLAIKRFVHLLGGAGQKPQVRSALTRAVDQGSPPCSTFATAMRPSDSSVTSAVALPPPEGAPEGQGGVAP